MPPERLSALDASFLAVEGPSAHTHVGWAATFAPPVDGPRPDFDTLFEHIAGRLGRAPRYRQRLAPDPLGLNAPLWIDAEDFDPAEHIHRSAAEDLPQLADAVLSEPLRRDRPLWEFWIADRLRDGRIGLVGKAHHCMVDGIAAVELGSLLLDLAPEPGPEEPEDDDWLPAPAPHALELLARGAWDRTREQLGPLRYPLAVARSPLALPGLGLRTARALAGAVLPVAPPSPLNEPGSPARPQGDGAGQRTRGGPGRAGQPHHVHVRRAARRRRRPGRPPHARRRRDPRAQGGGDAGGRRRRAQGAVLRAPAGAEGGRARAGEPAGLQPRRLEHPGAAHADVHVRLPAARRLPRRAALGPPRAVGGHDDDRRARLLRPLHGPGDAAGLRRPGGRSRRGARR